jgi:hypothetical protein
MFQLSIVDHIRLSFGHVVQNYTVHSRSADRLAGVAMHARTIILAMMAVSTGCGVAILLGAGRITQIAALVAGGLAFAIYAIVASIGIEERMLAHRFCANRLWLLCERYRALLAEIHDELVDRGTVLARRDELIQQFRDIYELSAPQARGAGQKSSRAFGSRKALSEAQIDEFLPESLRQTGDAAPQPAANH